MQKSRDEDKVVGFSSASLLPRRKCGGKPKEPLSLKAGRTSETAVSFQIQSHKTRFALPNPSPLI